MTLTLDTLNTAARADFTAALDGVFEHAPWVADRAAAHRPFPTVAALHDALIAEIARAPEQLDFLRGHPDLAADKLPPGLTAASLAEQTGLAMTGAAGAADLAALNRAYRDRFGIPFIVCVRRHTPENVLRTLRARLDGDPADERATALREIALITRLRLLARVDGPGAPPVAGHLSTHVLDTARGRPAADVAVTLLSEGRPVRTVRTDADGRTPPFLEPGPLRAGHHTLRFAVAPHLGPDALFDTIPIDFRITDPEARYHIPLLLSPYGYSTYRGS